MMCLKILHDGPKVQYLSVEHLSPGQIRNLAEAIAKCPHTEVVELFDTLDGIPIDSGVTDDRQE